MRQKSVEIHFFMCAAREIAPVRRGGRGAFFIDLFFCYFLLSAVQKSPPHFPSARIVDFQNIVSFNANMSVYLYLSILGLLKGLPLNTFENYVSFFRNNYPLFGLPRTVSFSFLPLEGGLILHLFNRVWKRSCWVRF